MGAKCNHKNYRRCYAHCITYLIFILFDYWSFRIFNIGFLMNFSDYLSGCFNRILWFNFIDIFWRIHLKFYLILVFLCVFIMQTMILVIMLWIILVLMWVIIMSMGFESFNSMTVYMRHMWLILINFFIMNAYSWLIRLNNTLALLVTVMMTKFMINKSVHNNLVHK